MSRSLKHVPCIHYASRNRGMKRVFNKRIRRMGLDEVPNYCAYKRLNESALDDDWRAVGEPYRQHLARYKEFEPEATEKQARYAYYRWYIGK